MNSSPTIEDRGPAAAEGAPAQPGHSGLDWRQVRILYLREIRAALREKTIVLNSILIPVFLYPFLLWAVLSGMMFVMGQSEGFVCHVQVAQWPRDHAVLRHRLESDRHLKFTETQEPTALSRPESEIREGSLDLFLEFLPPTNSVAALPGNFSVRLTYNESKDRSAEARNRVEQIIARYRESWLKRDGKRLGLDAAAWQGFTISTRNIATRKEMGAFLLGMLAPVIFVVMVAMGCFYPAVDALAGERERNTWETLMSSAASRLNVVTAKYLYVATFGGLAGILNLVAVIVSLRPIFAPLLSRAGKVLEANIPLAALPTAVLAAVLLAGFVAAGMMIFASFARTFKEGQAMVTPFYMMVMIPVVFLQAPGLKFSLALAFLPIVNVTLMVREAFAGTFRWLPSLVTVAVSLAAIALCLRFAAFVLKFEDVVTGSYTGSFGKFLRERWLRRRHRAQTKSPSTA